MLVDHMERKIEEVREKDDENEAERLLDEACDQCVNKFKAQMEDIKASVKQRGVNCTSPEDQQKYEMYVERVTASVNLTQGLFDTIFSRIRSIVTNVVDWIRQGVGWMTNVVTDTLKAIIRTLFGS